MSAISQKSISGITSITSPAGTDDQISLHTSNTNEALKIDGAGNIHIHNHVSTTGISSASNFKTGTSDLHSAGLNVAYADVDDFVDVGSNIKLGNAGVITATSFVGDGSDLTNLPAGLGTALSATASSPLNKMYYTNQVLGVPSSVTVNVPASASKAYTQYADIKVESSADLIVSEGDDLIPDILGLADFGTFGGGASAGRIRVNSISNAANDGSPTVQKGLVVTGVCTATSFSGSGANLTSLPAQATIANNADNRIITGGSGVNLNGESTLTYSGDTLLSTNSNFVIKSIDTNASNAENYIQFNAGYITYDSDASNATGYSGHYFQVDGSEKLRINGSGQLVFDADTDTYIHRPQANQLAITIAGGSFPIVRFGTGGSGSTVGFSTTNTLVTNAERISVRGYSSFKSDSNVYAAIYTHNEGNTNDTYNAHLLWNAGGANRGGIGYMPNTGEVVINNQNALNFATGATNLGGTTRLRIGNTGEVSLRRGGISATPSLEIYGSGNASDTDADNLRFHNWGNSSGDYWDIGVNHGLDGSGNNTKPSNTLKAAAIRLNAKNGAVTLITSPASTSTQYEGLTQNQSGQVTMPNQPMCCFNVSNTSAGNYMSHNSVLTNNGNHYNTGNGRFTCPVAGFYFATVMVMSNNNDQTMDIELRKNQINPNNILVPYSAATGGSYNQAVGSCIIDCAAGDYLQFKLNSGSVYAGRHSSISFCLLA